MVDWPDLIFNTILILQLIFFVLCVLIGVVLFVITLIYFTYAIGGIKELEIKIKKKEIKLRNLLNSEKEKTE